MASMRETNNSKFGKHVRKLRRARGMTQENLADRADLAADTIRRLEHGRFTPGLDTLNKLCVGLDLKLSTLFASYEGDSCAAAELVDLISSRPASYMNIASAVVRKLFDELDTLTRSP